MDPSDEQNVTIKKSKNTPPLTTRTLAGLFINKGRYSLMSVKTPRVGPGDNWGLVDQTDVFVLHRQGLCHYRQALVPFGPRKWDRPATRASDLGDARRSGRPGKLDAAKMGTDAEPPGGVT